MPPRQQVVDDLLRDQPLADQQTQHLGAKQPLDELRVEEREALGRAVAVKHPVGHEQVHVRMPTLGPRAIWISLSRRSAALATFRSSVGTCFIASPSV